MGREGPRRIEQCPVAAHHDRDVATLPQGFLPQELQILARDQRGACLVHKDLDPAAPQMPG